MTTAPAVPLYDLLVKGGTVVDPSQNLHQRLDLAVSGGRIASLAPDIAEGVARRVVRVTGCLVVPGLIDIHTHVYPGATPNGIDPDIAGVHSGVCTVVDAGSGGSHTVAGLVRLVAPRAKTRVLALTHIARTGLAQMPEIRSPDDADADAAIRAIQDGRPVVQGVKLRLVGPGVAAMGAEAIRRALRAAQETGTRLMVHIGDPGGEVSPEVTRQLLTLLRPGDIVTHAFTGNPGGLLDETGRAWPEVAEAVARGVWLDTAHGRMNFSFASARRLLDQGVIPHTISTDMTLPGRHTTVGSLTELMSKFLALGFTLEDVVRMVTVNAAKAIGMADPVGSLAVGREADITVLRLVSGRFLFRDTKGETLQGEKALVPVLCVRAGEIIPLDWGPRPWGWLPEQAP
ncbi:MAG: amidohydrolase/deacetylase family metallohydrolase [Dehalococcoidia bacterium]|nr:amidohydrolase/deacetylase family metallohydrolase [Dehalococcoidia bacterium]MDW8119570.1 amidohydrolase/deacetylase family metallohydrolase [Chloroflexota bacterium]